MDLISVLNNVKQMEMEPQLNEMNGAAANYNASKDDIFVTPIKSKFAARYKEKLFMTQEERRQNLLLQMKERRSQTVDEKRNLSDFFECDDKIEESDDDESEPMDIVKCHKRKRRRKNKVQLTNALMLSEWFTEIPLDLESNWLFKLCPSGVRNLVIAYKNRTCAYNRRGICQASFRSCLPGGNAQSKYGKFTVLDCIFHVQRRCYYVLDVLAWNSYSLKNCNCEMRFYWLKSKLSETPELKEKTGCNQYPFFDLEFFPSELPLIEANLLQPFDIDDDKFTLDGVLFFHRESVYVEAKTPLVGWLKPYMIPEMLSVPVNECFMKKRPPNYVSLQQYLESESSKTKNCSEKMDC